jgi:AraC-like DNA-binding protein
MELKPQDLLVCLKLCLNYAEQPTYSQLASELGMEESAIYRAVKRAQYSRLLRPNELRPMFAALEEFVVHGAKYAFPAHYTGGLTRGTPTAHAAPPLSELIVAEDEPVPVWSDAQGLVRGMPLSPLYKTAVLAAQKDERLYRILALLDALRIGRARERELATQHIRQILNEAKA